MFKRILMNAWESALYHLCRVEPASGGVRHIVFVCKGNICRSAFAEYYLRSLVPEGTMRIESCGIDAVNGTASPHEAVSVGKEFGVWLDEHRSKGLTACDIEKADLIVPMEYGHYQRLLARFPESKSKIRFIREFAPWPARLLCNTYDPYGLGEDEFRRCFSELREGLDRIKQKVVLHKN